MDTVQRSIFEETLESGAEAIGVPLTAEQISACAAYTDYLLTVNTHTNLTRITDPAAVAVKHFVDSLTVLAVLPGLRDDATIVDVGTGAGFPGVVLKIVRPGLRLTLLDSLAKRLSFLEEVSRQFGFTGVQLVHARAEDAGQNPALRERYDIVTARAVASLPTLLEWCGPLARVGGSFVAMKAESADTELIASIHAAKVLNLRLIQDKSVTLPPLSLSSEEEPAQRRRLLVFDKVGRTPSLYPRRPAEIKSKPL